MAESSHPPEVPHQPERHIFPRRQFGKSKVVSHALFKDLDLIEWLHYESTRDLAFCYTGVHDSHQDGEDEDCGKGERPCFHLQWLAFLSMKLASEKPPEAVLA